jgi:tetratricopeptide (TPR) repeat protein
VDRGVIATASELFEARHYPGVVAMCSDALEDEPECLPLLLIRARAQIALRRDLDAQADLRDIIRLDPRCGMAYRLLGELAARRDENEPAAVFFREALRLDPDDREAHDWLLIVEALLRPAAPAAKLPAPAAAAGRFVQTTRRDPAQVRFARGTQHPEQTADEPVERPTQPLGRSSDRRGAAYRTPPGRPVVRPAPMTLPPEEPEEIVPPLKPTLTGRPPTQPPAKEAPRLAPAPRTTRTTTRVATPELPGFGEYLVTTGVLTRARLRAAEAYQRSMKVQLSTAIVTLGLATPQRIEWAAVAHQSEVARERQLL